MLEYTFFTSLFLSLLLTFYIDYYLCYIYILSTFIYYFSFDFYAVYYIDLHSRDLFYLIADLTAPFTPLKVLFDNPLKFEDITELGLFSIYFYFFYSAYLLKRYYSSLFNKIFQ